VIWSLNLKPSEWGASLVFPLRAPAGDIYLSVDPSSLPAELMDEVMYVCQAAARPIEFLTFYPALMLAWMRSSPTRWELVQRLNEVRWVLAVAGAHEVNRLVPEAMKWPVAKRCIQSPERLNLSKWMRHEYSTIGHTGVCEDCGVGRAESAMHKPDAVDGFWRISAGEDDADSAILCA
jgi:hypothetical protein